MGSVTTRDRPLDSCPVLSPVPQIITWTSTTNHHRHREKSSSGERVGIKSDPRLVVKEGNGTVRVSTGSEG